MAGHGLRRTALRRRAGRPQLRRDPLGSRGTRHSAKSVRVLRTMSPNPLRVHLEGTRVYLRVAIAAFILPTGTAGSPRSEEHTSELQSRGHLVCRLLPETKN